jgi:hypothetical protein
VIRSDPAPAFQLKEVVEAGCSMWQNAVIAATSSTTIFHQDRHLPA